MTRSKSVDITVFETFDSFEDAVYWLSKYLDVAVSVRDASIDFYCNRGLLPAQDIVWEASFNGVVNG